MNATWKKHQRRMNRCNAARYTQLAKAICPRCHKPGAHFVMPSLGEAGFFVCDTDVVNTSAPKSLTARA